MKIGRYQLENGLRIIFCPLENIQSVTALALVKTGSRNEDKENNGVSHFLEHMFFKGTQKRPRPQDVVANLDSFGGEYNAFTSQEYTGFWAKIPAQNVDLSLDWLSDILLHSRFDSSEMEKEKGVIVEEINLYEDIPSKKIFHNWCSLLYGDQPLGWPILGSRENVLSMTRDKIYHYWQNQYQPSKIVLCLAGQIPPEKILLEKISSFFQFSYSGLFKEAKPIQENQTKPRVSLEKKKTDQSHLIIGFRGVGVNHPDRYVLEVISNILGGYMSSILFVEVREKKGLAYYIRSVTEFFTDTGFIAAQAGVSNHRIEEAVQTILEQFKKIQKGEIKKEEIEKAKQNLIGRLILSLETSDEIASWVGEQEILTGKILSPEEIIDKIRKVDFSDIQRVGKEIFNPQRLNLAIIGPFDQSQLFEDILKKY